MWESPTYRQEWQVTSTYFNKNLLHSSAQYDLSQVDRSIEAVATLLCLAGGDIIQCCLSHIYIGDVYQVFVWCLKKNGNISQVWCSQLSGDAYANTTTERENVRERCCDMEVPFLKTEGWEAFGFHVTDVGQVWRVVGELIPGWLS